MGFHWDELDWRVGSWGEYGRVIIEIGGFCDSTMGDCEVGHVVEILLVG